MSAVMPIEAEVKPGAAAVLPAAAAVCANPGERFLIAAGGTGGHVIPALQVAAALRGRGHECIFAGTPRGLENRLVPAAGFELRHVPVGPLNRVSWGRRWRTAAESPRALRAAWRLLDELAPAAVLSMGGYASGPLALSCALRETPLVVMEPNAVPGMANRIAGMFASRALLGSAAAAKYFRNGIGRQTGVPVRPEFFEREPRPANRAFTVLVTGGSQGSRKLNDAAVGAARYWRTSGAAAPRLIHQTGNNDFPRVCGAYREIGFAAETAPFYDDAPALYKRADLVICRAGASAVAELCAAGKASILVPFPHAADDHQLVNARELALAGGAVMVEDGAWTGEKMAQTVDLLRSKPADIAAMEAAAAVRAMPRAAEHAAGELETIARARGGAK